MDDGELLTTEEAWAYLGVSRAAFWNMLKRFPITSYKVPTRGKRTFFRKEDLDTLRRPVRVDPHHTAA